MSAATVEVLAEYAELEAPDTFWGRWCGLDLRGCDYSILTDPKAIEQYIVKVCELLKFRRFGDPTIVRFGNRPEIAGYSFTQLIETSLVSGHLVDSTCCAFIDIFSCTPYPINKAEAFTREYFRASRSMSHTVDRYAGHASEALARA
ncbi:MAG TPA: S-adenosylmethionine decarboxylase [Bryobacteraceae bacterium]|jgi:S-adenosylmethionine/arginine decarboxylase-like enzyme